MDVLPSIRLPWIIYDLGFQLSPLIENKDKRLLTLPMPHISRK
jgi:hypothetical protein